MHGEWQGCYRLRVGEYRVIFRYIEDGLEILTVGAPIRTGGRSRACLQINSYGRICLSLTN